MTLSQNETVEEFPADDAVLLEKEKNQNNLLKIWAGYQYSRALHVAAELGIADMLHEGNKTVEQLAKQTNTHQESLYRLLRALSSKGIFFENTDGTFSQSKMSDLLRVNSPDSVCNTVRMTDIDWWQAFGNLEYTVKTGNSAFKDIIGTDYFTYHRDNPEVSRRFENGMANYACMMNPKIVKSINFSTSKKVIDIGGGKGAFLSEVLRQNAHLTGVLCDRPDVVENHSYITKTGVESRCQFESINFFDSVPSGGDTYILQHILHDWNDDDCIKIIKNIKKAMSKSGRLLIIDVVLPPANKPHPGKITDLLMMALLEGKERTENEFKEILELSGFKINSVTHTRTTLSVIEAIPL
ncbi:methyltransferase [Aliikangiella sp. IMCC44359]|uniref:methyltransferase n=1 Tax=Aliikangiella sp. IMCC44359 TaxID=3459125 RepID=UPI00403AD391